MKTILMCEPKAFAVNYEINPWMNFNIGKVNYFVAYKQWENLYKILQNLNVNLVVMRNQPKDLPDLVFTANAALVINGNALISHFAYKERQSESILYNDFLRTLQFKTDTYFIDNDIYFEGAGDALLEKHKNILVLGYGFRTEKKAYNYVKNFLEKVSPKTELIHAELINPDFYHLDTCFCPLDNGYIIYYPEAFSKKTLNEFNKKFENKLIPLSKEDAMLFGCNAVSVDNNLVLNKASKELKTKLQNIGVKVLESSLDQYILSGGSAKCLTLELSLLV